MSGTATLFVNQGQAVQATGVSNQMQPAGNISKALPYLARLQSATTDTLNLTNPQSQGVIDQIQTVYINNRDNGSAITIRSSIGQEITCPGGSQGWFPVLSANPPIFTFTSDGGVNVPVIFANMPMPVGVWSAISSRVSQPVTLVNRSTTTPGVAASTQLMAANSDRTYLLIKAPETQDLWINPFGGIAAIDSPGCFKILAGGAYESAVEVWSGAINYFTAATNAELAAAESG